VTITSGAALAPDDDESSVAANGHTATATDAGISLVLGRDAIGGISLAVAPAVVGGGQVAVTPAVVSDEETAAPPTGAPPLALADRIRGALPFTGPGLTGLGAVILGCLVVGLGAFGDLALGDGLGGLFDVTFLLGCVLVASTVRTRALAVAMVLPPLLFAGGYLLESKSSGQTTGRREMALDVATSLALHAPLLFVGSALAIAIGLVRIVVRLIRR
jgi:hypothetical protein